MFDLVTENSFDLNKTKEYHLSIQVNLDGFSFFIVNPKENQLVAFRHETLRISNEAFVARRASEWMEEQEIFTHPYKRVQLVHWSKQFALVPQGWTNEGSKSVLQLLYHDKIKDNILVNHLSDFHKSLIFTMPAQLQEFIKKKFPECFIYHPLKKISGNLPELHSNSGHGLVLAVSPENFYLLIYSKSDILLMNHYRFSHANDVVYYVLSVLKQLGISPKRTELLLSGVIKKEDKIKEMLEPHFYSTNYLSPITSIHFNTLWFDGTEHRFLTLY